MTCMSALEHKADSFVDRAAGRKQRKCHVGVTKGLTVQEVLVSYLNAHNLVKLGQFLDRDFHVLSDPGRVLSSVDASV